MGHVKVTGEVARASFTYVAPTLSGTTTSQLVQVSVDGDFDGSFDVFAPLTIVQGTASGSIIAPTGSLNIPATDGANVTLTATFHDANGKPILAGSGVTVTTTLGTLTAPGPAPDGPYGGLTG